MDRRAFLKSMSLIGAAPVLLFLDACSSGAGNGAAAVPNPAGGSSAANPQTASPASPAGTPFQTPLPVPSPLPPVRSDASADYYEITMRPAQAAILPGLPTTIWGYNGQFPGPLIEARRGRQVVVHQSNSLPEGVTVHFHGGHVPGTMDGHPTDLIPPGGAKDYVYPNNQIGATLWYHDHAMDRTGLHIYQGLAGMYLLRDDVEDALPLPKGPYEIPLMIQDRAFNPDGSLNYIFDVMKGALGDTILVNGAVQPYVQVAARKYRFRILNASNAREYELALSTGQPFVQIGHETLLPAPVSRTSIRLLSAERADVVIDFSASPLGTRIILQNILGSGPTAQIMRFDVVRSAPDDSQVPATLRPYTPLSATQAQATRRWVFGMQMGGMASGGGGGAPMNGGGMPMGAAASDPWVINGQLYDPNRIDTQVPLNHTEIWEFQNMSNMAHPVHMHDVMFQILDRNGQAPAPYEQGFKETVRVDPMETVRVIAQFTDYTGIYMLHCHILEHEDHAMMAQFQVA